MRVVDSLDCAIILVWFTYWRGVFSFSAMLETERPLVMSDQMSFWLWLSGEAAEQLVGILSRKYNTIYQHLNFVIL
jgi:hypothetical protein